MIRRRLAWLDQFLVMYDCL